MGAIYDAVEAFFKADDWDALPLSEQGALRLSAEGSNGQWSCYAQVLEDLEEFIFYSVYPGNAPESKRAAMAELLARINFGLALGHFELDFDDGHIRFKTSIGAGADQLSPELIRRVVYANIATMDRYLPGITGLLENDDKTPAEIVAQVEAA
jgi:hypothetical protein